MRIADLLPTKQDSALSYKSLCILTGLSERDVRRAIRRERRQGVAILTCCEKGRSGIWLWDGVDQKEFDKCYFTIVGRGVDMLETARLMKERYKVEG